MVEHGMDYNSAHRIAEKEFNYKRLTDMKDGMV